MREEQTARRDEPPAAGDAESILQPGRNCWRIERADRLTLIVDAQRYFSAAKAAIRRARHSVMLIGWHFDLHINLEPDHASPDPPDQLGTFLKAVAAERPELHIYVLQWDGAMLATILHQIVPMLALELMWHRRIHFRLDSDHPTGACHHQKIIVVDDALAFCGGIDMTADRWDTREHRDGDPCRVRPDGSSYGPFHDATVAVDGEAARALGELARERWRCATGRRLTPPTGGSDPWPSELEPTLRDVEVAIARTHPARAGRPAVHEIKQLYLDAIGSAREAIYLESQYFASSAIVDALASKLADEDGPEVLVVNPERAAGWLEEEAMDTVRAILVDRLRQADRHGRFRICSPLTAGGAPIYVHAKILIVDDRFLRVGSSNVNNRSLGFDTECDLAIEAPPGQAGAAMRATIARFRDGLLAEHLGIGPETMADARRDRGSLIAAFDTLRRSEGRTLRPLRPEPPNDAERLLAELRLLNPERPGQAERRVTHRLKRLVLAPGRALADVVRRLADPVLSWLRG